MNLSLIVAVSQNNIIGDRGALPWHLSSDLQRFKRLTTGHAIIMGRRTYESIGRLLPGRTTVILTRRAGLQIPGAVIVNDVDQMVCAVAGDPEPFVVGGAEVYRVCLPLVTRMYVTRIHAAVEGDRQLCDIDWNQWALIDLEPGHLNERNDYEHTFETYERRCPVALDRLDSPVAR